MTKQEFKKSLSYLEAGLDEVKIERQKIRTQVQKRLQEAGYMVEIRAEERKHLQRSRTLLEEGELDLAIKELDTVDILHKEKA